MSEKLKVVYRSIHGLLPYANNAMQHSPEQVAQLVASIEEFGWTNPILIDESGEIIAGHGRVLAAEQLGFTPIPTIQLSGLSVAQKRAYRIADNQIPRNSGWDNLLLTKELKSLEAEGVDLGLTGFNELELSTLFQIEPDDPSDHWQGMPDFNQEDNNGCRQLIVHFETTADVENFASLVGQKLTDKTKYIWYPEHKRESTVNKAYISDEP